MMSGVFRVTKIVVKRNDSGIGIEFRGTRNGMGTVVDIGVRVIIQFVVDDIREIEDVFFMIHGECWWERDCVGFKLCKCFDHVLI